MTREFVPSEELVDLLITFEDLLPEGSAARDVELPSSLETYERWDGDLDLYVHQGDMDGAGPGLRSNVEWTDQASEWFTLVVNGFEIAKNPSSSAPSNEAVSALNVEALEVTDPARLREMAASVEGDRGVALRHKLDVMTMRRAVHTPLELSWGDDAWASVEHVDDNATGNVVVARRGRLLVEVQWRGLAITDRETLAETIVPHLDRLAASTRSDAWVARWLDPNETAD